MLWETSEDFAQFVEWCCQESRNSFERGSVWGGRMSTRWNEHLGASKALAHILRLVSRQGLLECGEVMIFFFLDVLAKFGPERLDGWSKLGIVRRQLLELTQELFDLFDVTAVSQTYGPPLAGSC